MAPVYKEGVVPTFPELAPLTQQKLLEGLALFNAGRWWHAHEAWEDAWRVEAGLTKVWLQALIQLAAAYHKGLRMGNPRGMTSLFEASLAKLEKVAAAGSPYGGVDVALACEGARRGRDAARAWADGSLPGFDLATVIIVDPPA